MMRKRTGPCRTGIRSTGALAPVLMLFALTQVYASPTTIVLGGRNGWDSAARLDRLELVSGRYGMRDLELLPFSYETDDETELLLHFDSAPLTDAAGNFRVSATAPEISYTTRRTGAGSLLVDDPADQVLITPTSSRLFQPGVEWGSFTLDFWLYPVALASGERILYWSGREGAAYDFRLQEIAVTVENRRLRFALTNFFAPPDGSEYSVVLEGDEGLLPRRWSHHMLRFDAETALLEYLVDGRTAAVTHVSASGSEDGTIFFPRTARYTDGSLRLVSSFTGAIDEVRVVRRFESDPEIPEFYPDGGVYESSVIDLGSPGALVTGITAVTQTPAMTDVFLYYRTANSQRGAYALGGEWIPVAPASFPLAQSRFIQLRAELYPDFRTSSSPALSEIEVTYIPDPPPAPPAALRASPGDGSVELSWSPVLDEDIQGYLVYYGTRPGRYFGSDGTNGPSPIDVGRATSILLSGLHNGTLYYFAVSAYDAAGVHSTTELSVEVAARPAKVYQ